MKPQIWAALLVALVIAAPAAAEQSAINLSGHGWETGGFPPSLPGDELEAVGIVNAIRPPLFWSPDIYAYTWHLHGLVSQGESVNGTTRIVLYTGGEFAIHVDWAPSNHEYGSFPPNSTSPSTFTDGHGVYLHGNIEGLTLTYNSTTASGSFVGDVVFTDGNAYPQLMAPDGWAVGADVSDTSPDGYDLQVNGRVYVDGPLGVEAETWGALKALYR
jgi:hypothetical protein